MTHVTRREFLGITATGLGGLWLADGRANASPLAATSGAFESLYKSFQDPDRKHSIRPFWFWNGKLESAELDRQIRLMAKHGVYGAYAHNRDGLETPYLSEEWWEAVGAALKTAREVGFSLCFVDEFEWPSGEARDYWMPGINKSRVVAADPGFRMLRLRPEETAVQGPRRVEIPLPERTTLVLAAKHTGAGRLEENSMQVLPSGPGAKSLSWEVPAGKWRIFTYSLEPTYGMDGGTVDLMNPQAVRKFIEVYYEEFHRRYGEYFGNTMPATFADHEGTYGGKLAWTPKLFETFRQKKGYDLSPVLPALTHDVGPKTEKIRCDYQDVISDLYTDSFFKQVNAWCREHHLDYSGHVWEESLFFGPAYQGDFYRILRGFGNPGCDSLVEWGRQSVWLKEVASIADFEGRHVVCENQGVQGGDSYLSLERMRLVSNCLGAWNIGEFIPHAFDYDLNRINFAPDWFFSQPFLPYFRTYADQMRRISFMNCASYQVADILLFYPQVSIWGQSAPVYLFNGPGGIQSSEFWTADANRTNSSYTDLKVRLSEQRLDYKVADDSYFAESKVVGNELAISTSRFKLLVLPPMSTMQRSSAERVAEFYRAGGTVIAQGPLAHISVEAGRNDASLKALWDATFDTAPADGPYTLRRNEKGGRAYFVAGSVEDVAALLGEIAERDVEVADGPVDNLYALHKQKDGVDFYWVVNDTAKARTNFLRLHATGRPERWDAVTGKREALFYQTAGRHTLVRLTLHPWDAAYIAFDPQGPAQSLELKATNLDELAVVSKSSSEVVVRGRSVTGTQPGFVEFTEGQRTFRGSVTPAPAAPLELTGDWTATVDSPSIHLAQVEAQDDPQGRGLKERWYKKASHIGPWKSLWLSPMNCSIREWNLIGPFPNPDDHGLEHAFAPEHEIDYRSAYEGDAEREVRWLRLDAAEDRVAPELIYGWDWAAVPNAGGRYAPDSFVIHYGPTLKLGAAPAGTVYAQTNIFVSEAQDAIAILATPNPSTVWLNDKQVHSRWVRPSYYQLQDGFAFKIPVRLKAGWNSLLLKFLHNSERPKDPSFTCRLETPDHHPIQSLVASPRPTAGEGKGPSAGFRWLRLPVCALVRSVRIPSFERSWLAFVDGKRAPATQEIPLPRGARQVVLRVDAREVLHQPFELQTTPAPWPLGTWNIPSLEHFSGAITYEKTVEVPASLLKERVLLDCGQVGAAAEAWINGVHAGVRPWQPFVFDLTGHLQPGSNHLKVRVTNTEGNARAVGESISNLKNIDLNGWLGPVRLVPYWEREIGCRPL